LGCPQVKKSALERAEIIGDDVSMKTPAGKFANCLKVEETTALDAAEKYYKTYAPGVCLIQDEDLLLVKWGNVN